MPLTPHQLCKRKRRYACELDAIHGSIESSAKFGKPFRWYRCDCCRGYHITSQVRR